MWIDRVLEQDDGLFARWADRSTQVFCVDNVRAYAEEHVHLQDEWWNGLVNMSVRPPFEHMWIEYKERTRSAFVPCGALVRHLPLEEAGNAIEGSSGLSARRLSVAASIADGLSSVPGFHFSTIAVGVKNWLTALPEDPDSLVSLETYWPRRGRPNEPYAYSTMYGVLDATGGLIAPSPWRFSEKTRIDKGPFLGVTSVDVSLPNDPEEVVQWANDTGLVSEGITAIALWTCAFLHCKNVAVDTHRPDDKMQRARIRRKKPPFVVHKTLRIVAPGAATTAGGVKGAPVGDMPLHIVRGHFAHFADQDGKRLFGRYHGTFWRPAHVRGNEEVGVVYKDYEPIVDEEKMVALRG